MNVVVTCGDAARVRYGSRVAVTAVLPARPDRASIDPLLDAVPVEGRLVVAGDDAALGAVVRRLLRRERLDVAVALLPSPGSTAAAVWQLPTDPDAALAVARDGRARPAPLVRDDRGGVVLGRHRVGPFTGEVYVDETRLIRGDATGLEVRPDPAGHGTVARVLGPRRLLGLRAGAAASRAGRAVQLGCRPVTVDRDGEPDERTITRRSWYPHTGAWALVRPAGTGGDRHPGQT